MYIYRSAAGRRDVAEWCERELESRLPAATRCTIDSPLGPTHLTTLGSGPFRVLFLPGTNMNAATSIPLIEALARHGRVTVADEPGQPGLSAGHRPDGDLVGCYERWVDHLVDSTDERPVVLVGESRGAAVALCASPVTAIGGLVLVSPAGLVAARVTPSVLRSALPWLLRPTPARSGRMLTTMYADTTAADHPRLTAWMTLVGRHVRTSLAPAPLPNAIFPGWRDVPGRVLVGQADRFFPPRSIEPAVTGLLGAETTAVDRGGHLLSHTRPDSIVDAVLSISDR